MRFLAVLLLLGASGAQASGGGSSGAEFLRVAPGARAAALGESFTGLADDVTAAAWNPAGLARLKGLELSAMHLSYLADATHEFVAAGMPAGGIGGLALLGTYVNVPSFDSTDPAAGTSLPAGSGGDALVGLAWGSSLGAFMTEEPWYKDVYVGAAAKYVRRSLGGYVDASGAAKTLTASTVAADLGLLYQARRDVTVGLAVQNLGGSITFLGDERDPLPLTVRGGLAWAALERSWIAITVLADAVKPVDSSGGTFERGVWGGAGAEVRLADLLALRAGARQGPDGFRAVGGAGVSWSGVSLDAAYIPLGDLGVTGAQGLRVGMSLKLGGGRPRLAAVRNLMGEALPKQGVHLRWDSQEIAEGYHVEMLRPGEASFVRVTKIPRPSPELSLNGLKPSSEYGFRVVALDAKGREGPASASVTVRTPAPPSIASPANLKAVPGRGKVTLSWNPVAGAAGYHLYLRGNDGKWVGLTKAPVTKPQVTMKIRAGPRVFAVVALGTGGTKSKARSVKTTILR